MRKKTILLLFILYLLPASLNAALVAEWKFEEGSGTTTADSSGNNNTGTLTNSPTWVTGKVGDSALEFDGVNDYVDCGSNPILNITSSITVCAWVFTSADNAFFTIASKHGAPGDYGWALRRDSDVDGVEFGISPNGTEWISKVTGSDCFEINTWYHIAATSDGKTMRVYINGIEYKGTYLPFTFTSPGTPIHVSNTNLQLGVSNNGQLLMKGIIDEVKIYNNALNATEILTLYNTYFPAPIAPTITIINPTDGATVSGAVNFNVNASADEGVKQVYFYVDGNIKYYTATTGTINWVWDTTKYSNGNHTIKASITDILDQIVYKEITVKVFNYFATISTVTTTTTDVGVTTEISPRETILNPIKGGKSSINYTVGNKAVKIGEYIHVTVQIFNATGELIKTLVDQDMPAGTYQSVWEGKNFDDEVIASGVYIARLRAGSYTSSKKILVVK
ncbi:MAG: hypothetical protein A2539_10540 [Elusimicrobia bacterium RIFOXYD2_FULL_34_15]|nr:MAG: hypothetical protein A2539_10540 [Elusimicrobia bacterium RIFOXYD2_FULL_34_15]